MRAIRIGAGSAYSGDRIEPAIELADAGNLDFLVFECLAERTIALAQQRRSADPETGYDPLLEDRLRAVLKSCHSRGVKIVSNMGAANPVGAVRRAAALARGMGLKGIKFAAVEGDDVLHLLKDDAPLYERTGRLGDLDGRIISANAYLGAEPVVEALKNGADVIITGRLSDTALFLAPMAYAFDWRFDDWDKLGQGTAIGHLLECAGQITGGYFADPGKKNVPRLAQLGFPIAQVSPDGTAIITKVAGTGGLVSLKSCKEQLLYEIHDPRRYLQPDVIADFSSVSLTSVCDDAVEVAGGRGSARPETLKVSVGYRDSFVGEGQISYAGYGALERAKLALSIIEERVRLTSIQLTEMKMDIIGLNSLLGSISSRFEAAEPHDVRIRAVGRSDSMHHAMRFANEVEALWTNGPAGGGGATKAVREIVAVASLLIPRQDVRPHISYEVA